jgi:hypothetical protein
MIIPGVGLLEMRPAEGEPGVGVIPAIAPAPAIGERGAPAGNEAASDAPQLVQKRVASSFEVAQAGHDFMSGGPV